MSDIIDFPQQTSLAKTKTSNIGMTLTRNINGLTVSVNLAKLSKEELLQALMPLPSQSLSKQVCEIEREKISLVEKYLNQ